MDDEESYKLTNVSNILTISSRNRVISNENHEPSIIDRDINQDDMRLVSYIADSLDDAGIAYVANTLERNLLDCGQIYCYHCKHILEDNSKLEPRFCIGGFRPCIGTFKLCKSAEKALKIYHSQVNCKSKVLASVFQDLDISSLYTDDEPDRHDPAHIEFIIQFVLNGYIRTSQNRRAKNDTLDWQNRFMRQNYRHNIQFSGQ